MAQKSDKHFIPCKHKTKVLRSKIKSDFFTMVRALKLNVLIYLHDQNNAQRWRSSNSKTVRLAMTVGLEKSVHYVIDTLIGVVQGM